MKKLIGILLICLALFLVGCEKNNDNNIENEKIKTDEEIVTQFLKQNEVWEDTETLQTSFGFYISTARPKNRWRLLTKNLQ